MVSSLLVAQTILLSFGQAAIPQTDSPSWKQRLRKDAPAAWKKYDAWAKRLQGSWSLTVTARYDSPSRKPQEDHYRYQLKQRDDCAMCLDQSPTSGELRIANPKYSFQLHRGRDNAPWAVMGVGKNLLAPSTTFHPMYMARLTRRLPYTFAEVSPSLQVTVLDKGFLIKNVSLVRKGNQQLVEVVFTYTPPDNPVKKWLRSGSVFFDPEHYWVIRGFDVKTQRGNDAAHQTGSYNYKSSGGYPVLEKIIHKIEVPTQDGLHAEYIRQFDLHPADVPAREFRLSAFGFPEPQGVVWNDGSTHWYLWFIALAVVSLLAGAYFRYRIQRRKKLAQDAVA